MNQVALCSIKEGEKKHATLNANWGGFGKSIEDFSMSKWGEAWLADRFLDGICNLETGFSKHESGISTQLYPFSPARFPSLPVTVN